MIQSTVKYRCLRHGVWISPLKKMRSSKEKKNKYWYILHNLTVPLIYLNVCSFYKHFIYIYQYYILSIYLSLIQLSIYLSLFLSIYNSIYLSKWYVLVFKTTSQDFIIKILSFRFTTLSFSSSLSPLSFLFL